MFMDKSSRLQRLKQRLEQYYAAEDAILGGAQSYQIGSRQLTRANLTEVNRMINYLEKEIADLESTKGRNRVIGVIPRDL